MSIELITIQELLRDPQYREYFLKVPHLPDHYTPANKPWKLLVFKHNEDHWRSKRFGTYPEAFDGLKKLLKAGVIDNAAINCPALGFMPPTKLVRIKGKVDPKTKKPVIKTIVWRPQIPSDLEQHHWCPHCRRPSVFKDLAVNLNRGGSKYRMPPGDPLMRCVICGASERIVNLRYPEQAQRWDQNRPRIYA